MGDLKQAIEQLKMVGARVLGVVLDEINPSNPKYGYYYSRHYSLSFRHYGSHSQSSERTVAVPVEPSPPVPRVLEQPEPVAVLATTRKPHLRGKHKVSDTSGSSESDRNPRLAEPMPAAKTES